MFRMSTVNLHLTKTIYLLAYFFFLYLSLGTVGYQQPLTLARPRYLLLRETIRGVLAVHVCRTKRTLLTELQGVVGCCLPSASLNDDILFTHVTIMVWVAMY